MLRQLYRDCCAHRTSLTLPGSAEVSMGLHGTRSQEQNQITFTISLGQVHYQLNGKWTSQHPCSSVIPEVQLSQELVHQAPQDSVVHGPHRNSHDSKECCLHCESGSQGAGGQKEPLERAVLLSLPTPLWGHLQMGTHRPQLFSARWHNPLVTNTVSPQLEG